MGMKWEAYHKGVPLKGVPEISLETMKKFKLYLEDGYWIQNQQEKSEKPKLQ